MIDLEFPCNAIEDIKFDPRNLESPERAFLTDLPVLQPGHCRREVDIAIIGTGPLGVALGLHIWHQPELRDSFVLLDAQPRLLESFWQRTKILHQKVMRSPYEQQMAPDGDLQLLDYARLNYSELLDFERAQVALALRGQRSVVPRDLFFGHAVHLIRQHGLEKRSYIMDVDSIELMKGPRNRWAIKGSDGTTIECRAVILAGGSRENRCGSWAKTLGDRIVSSPYVTSTAAKVGEKIAVVGSGLAAGHIIKNTIEAGARVTWISRDQLRYRCADFQTSYFRTEGIASFQLLSIGRKMEVLEEASKGSLMPEFSDLINCWTSRGNSLECNVGQVLDLKPDGNSLKIALDSGKNLSVERVIFATGLKPNVRLITGLTDLVGGLYPETEPNSLELCGLPNLFAVGPLACLSLGPAARNIDGARLAAQIIVPVLVDRFGKKSRKSKPRGLIVRGTAALSFPPGVESPAKLDVLVSENGGSSRTNPQVNAALETHQIMIINRMNERMLLTYLGLLCVTTSVEQSLLLISHISHAEDLDHVRTHLESLGRNHAKTLMRVLKPVICDEWEFCKKRAGGFGEPVELVQSLASVVAPVLKVSTSTELGRSYLLGVSVYLSRCGLTDLCNCKSR